MSSEISPFNFHYGNALNHADCSNAIPSRICCSLSKLYPANIMFLGQSFLSFQNGIIEYTLTPTFSACLISQSCSSPPGNSKTKCNPAPRPCRITFSKHFRCFPYKYIMTPFVGDAHFSNMTLIVSIPHIRG